ncbi:MAG: hypothetical protein ACI4OT_01205 [Bacilli bacterium]
MIKLTDKVLDIVNEEKTKRGLADTHAPLVPTLIRHNNDLKILVLLTKCDDNVWDINENIKADYWVLLNVKTFEIEEFNKTSEKDYIDKEIKKASKDDTKEIVEYSINKKIEYKNYLKNDIINNSIPIQDKLAKLLDNKIKVDDEYVDLNLYITANIENDVNEFIDKVLDDLVDLAVRSKYTTITYYYDELFNRIVEEYINNNNISEDKLEGINEILRNYYVGVLFI